MYPQYWYSEFEEDANGNSIITSSQCSNAVCTTVSKMVLTVDDDIIHYTCNSTSCNINWQGKCTLRNDLYGSCINWQDITSCNSGNCNSPLPDTIAGYSKEVINTPDVIAAENSYSADECPNEYIKQDERCIYSTEEHEIICAYGYTSGCVAGEVTLADGSKVMMQNGQIVSNNVDESSCYANGQVYWDNACVDEYPFSKKRWTPAEAAKWLKDEDNSVIITFKK